MLKIRRIISFLIVFSVIFAMSCGEGNTAGDDESTDAFTLEKLKSAKIVRPDIAEQYEIDVSLKVKELISEKYGIELDIVTDWVMRGESVPQDTYEILVGNTNRDASSTVYQRINGTFQYGITYDGHKIAIGGDNYLSLSFALKLLEDNFMKDNEITISKGSVYAESMTDSEIEYIRNETNSSKHVGRTDTMTDEDKTHGKYTLVFSEEFNGDKINTDVWNYEYGYIANNELQCYNNREKNSRIDSDCLIIEAHKEQMNGFEYTSARLNTKGKYSFKYGYIEMRAILPEGQGIWPAFWMMGNNGSWPACGEIDIMEMIGGSGREDTVHGTVHWGTSNPYNHMSYGLSTTSREDLSEEFHTYAVEWNESTIKWYLDGKQFCVIDITGEQFDMFRQEFFIIVNLAVGGDWPGSPNAQTVFPQQYIIDYIRVYQ